MEQGTVNNVPNVGPAGAEQATPGQVVAEQITVAQVEEPVAAGPSVVEPEAPKKKGHGMLIGLILCLLLAAGGIGFGVWTMLDGNAKVDSLNKQIADLKKQNNDLLDKLNKVPTVEEEDVTVDVETESDVNPADYIYVGEWGLKIKVPEKLKRVSYSLRQFSTMSSGTTFLWVWGNIDERLPDFSNPSSNASPLGTIGRLPISSLDGNDCHSDAFELVFSDGEYNYCYSHPQGLVSDPNSEMHGPEGMTIELIQGMLKSKDNYSAI